MLNNPIYITAQIIGFIPMIIAFFTFLFNDRKKIIFSKAISDLLWAVHFFMLGEPSGGAINTVNVARNLVFSQKGNKKWASSAYIPVFFCIVSAVCTILTQDSIKGILPLVGSCLAIIGFWCTDPHNVRKFNLPGVTLWLIYGILTLSISSIISNTLSTISIIITEIKYRKKSKA